MSNVYSKYFGMAMDSLNNKDKKVKTLLGKDKFFNGPLTSTLNVLHVHGVPEKNVTPKRNTFFLSECITHQLSKYLVSMDVRGSQPQFDTNHGFSVVSMEVNLFVSR